MKVYHDPILTLEESIPKLQLSKNDGASTNNMKQLILLLLVCSYSLLKMQEVLVSVQIVP